MRYRDYDIRNHMKDRCRVFHRCESEEQPGTIMIIDPDGKTVTPERLEHIRKVETGIVVIDICTSSNKELFT